LSNRESRYRIALKTLGEEKPGEVILAGSVLKGCVIH